MYIVVSCECVCKCVCVLLPSLGCRLCVSPRIYLIDVLLSTHILVIWCNRRTAHCLHAQPRTAHIPRTKHSIRQTRDKADLLSSVQRDINTYQNEQQRRQVGGGGLCGAIRMRGAVRAVGKWGDMGEGMCTHARTPVRLTECATLGRQCWRWYRC